MTAMLAFLLSEKASTKYCAALISACQPFLPKLPLPSIRSTTSTTLKQGIGLSTISTLHRCMPHCLYSRRSLAHLSGQVPAPWEGSLTNFWRFWVPPSQSLEQRDHLVHAPRTQSFSHACPLHALVSDVGPHGLPLYFIASFTSRRRCWTPPPHSALHLLQPLQTESLQSTGHGTMLQLLSAASGRHLAPPFGWVSTLRVNFCSPLPHFFVHSSGSHLDTSQSWKNAECPPPFIL